jgi:hypothetical protein
MKLFHVSEESDIEIFNPRLPTRDDLDPNKGLVWALCERALPNFLVPRDCPRVTYHIGAGTTKDDIEKYISSPSRCSHVVIIESTWFDRMRNTTLYLYEFASDDFYLQDECAGYYVSEKPQKAVNKIAINDLFAELWKRNVELRVVDNLWEICDKIKKTSFMWSMCRMRFAKDSLTQ